MTISNATPPSQKKLSRREQILQALASMLEAHPGGRITTAQLAKQVGVSEAALYRHFPSKTKMFEALISFIEEAIFSRITLILREQECPKKQLQLMLTMITTFCARNPGISRIMTGDAIVGEHPRLQQRTDQIYERLELQIKQILRTGEANQTVHLNITIAQSASILMAFLEGKIFKFVRSRFKHAPTENWELQLEVILQPILHISTNTSHQTAEEVLV